MQQILAARDQEMRGQRQNGTATRNQLRGQMPAGRAKYDAQLKAVLTPDQSAKLTALQAECLHRDGRGPRFPSACKKPWPTGQGFLR